MTVVPSPRSGADWVLPCGVGGAVRREGSRTRSLARSLDRYYHETAAQMRGGFYVTEPTMLCMIGKGRRRIRANTRRPPGL